MWVWRGGKWRNVASDPQRLADELLELVRETLEGVKRYGPPPPLSHFRYVREPVAKVGPRVGVSDDRWLPWWLLPKDKDGFIIGDCEDLTAAWVPRQILDGVPAWPTIEETPAGFHALAYVDEGDDLLPEGYWTPTGAPQTGVLFCPSYARGMFDPRRSPAQRQV